MCVSIDIEISTFMITNKWIERPDPPVDPKNITTGLHNRIELNHPRESQTAIKIYYLQLLQWCFNFWNEYKITSTLRTFICKTNQIDEDGIQNKKQPDALKYVITNQMKLIFYPITINNDFPRNFILHSSRSTRLNSNPQPTNWTRERTSIHYELWSWNADDAPS